MYIITMALLQQCPHYQQPHTSPHWGELYKYGHIVGNSPASTQLLSCYWVDSGRWNPHQLLAELHQRLRLYIVSVVYQVVTAWT